MLKKDVTYEDYNGNTKTKAFYFNLSVPEIFEIQEGYDEEGGLEEALRKIIEAENIVSVAKEIKRIMLAAYGVKSEDGEEFIKSDELRKKFEQSAAFSELFFQVSTNEELAATFIPSLIPKNLGEELAKLAAKEKAAKEAQEAKEKEAHQEVPSPQVSPTPPTT